jgi:hypothetical protein
MEYSGDIMAGSAIIFHWFGHVTNYYKYVQVKQVDSWDLKVGEKQVCQGCVKCWQIRKVRLWPHLHKIVNNTERASGGLLTNYAFSRKCDVLVIFETFIVQTEHWQLETWVPTVSVIFAPFSPIIDIGRHWKELWQCELLMTKGSRI